MATPALAISAHLTKRYDLTIDHRVPVMLGGTDSDGLAILCRSCNSRRGAQLGNRMRSGRFGVSTTTPWSRVW
jgi:5-methylcytosine-specific restriction endonuclease McrA